MRRGKGQRCCPLPAPMENASGIAGAVVMAAVTHNFRLVGDTLAVGTAILRFIWRNATTGGVRTFLGSGHSCLLPGFSGAPLGSFCGRFDAGFYQKDGAVSPARTKKRCPPLRCRSAMQAGEEVKENR